MHLLGSRENSSAGSGPCDEFAKRRKRRSLASLCYQVEEDPLWKHCALTHVSPRMSPSAETNVPQNPRHKSVLGRRHGTDSTLHRSGSCSRCRNSRTADFGMELPHDTGRFKQGVSVHVCCPNGNKSRNSTLKSPKHTQIC